MLRRAYQKFVVRPQGGFKSLGLLLARLSVGVVFMQTGWGKLHNLSAIIDFFRDLGIPYPELQAPFVSSLELLGGLALIAGLFTRIMSVQLMGTMVVAILTAKKDDIESWTDVLGFIEWHYLVVFGVLVLLGPGRASLDALLAEVLFGRKMAPLPASAPGAKRIVILGGGFAGAYAALELEERYGNRTDVELILVSKENYFVFQPMLPEVISGTINVVDVVTPLRRMLKRTHLHIREVESIDVEARTVTCSPGFHPHAHVLKYDELVLALGNVTDFRGMPGLPEHAFPFKNLTDALELRNQVIRALDEAAILPKGSPLRQRLLSFVVAGGGFSGVEVVAELNDFVRVVVEENYPAIDCAELQLTLLHGQDRILPEMDKSLALFAQRLLENRGVRVRLNARLASASAEAAVLADGTVLPTRTLVSTIPSSPHPAIEAAKGLERLKNGKVVTEPTLQAKGLPHVWALGDCAAIPISAGSDMPQYAPPTAQHAIREARLLADNLLAKERQGKLETFAFKGLGKMGSLGRHSAVAEVLGIKLSGFLAWWLWRTVYLMKVPSTWRRVKIAIGWTLDLVLPPELVQLKLGDGRGIARHHYRAGEQVFSTGDTGDRLYVVVHGAAEVLREGSVVAQLGPGELFGEAALVGMHARTADVRAKDALTVLSVRAREFHLLLQYLPGVKRSIDDLMSARGASAPPPQI
jgi:NADH dehydrogenase